VIVADEAIGREIRQLREDTKNGLAKIESGLDKLLPREVYSANHEALKRRVEVLERDFERLEAERDHDVERAAEQRKADVEKSQADRVASRRWAITAIVVPTVSLIASIVLALTT
jgi:hypothetical protein